MSSAKITLIGFYNYDSTLFDGLDLPQQIDKNLLVDCILMRGGEYEVIYSNPDFLKQAMTSWSKQWKPTFTEWCRAFDDLKEVAPLENYDRIENWSDSMSNSENESLSTSESMASSESSQGSSSTSGSDSSSSSESMSQQGDVSAYDSSNLVTNDGQSKSAQANNTASTYTTQGNTTTSSHNNTANGSQDRNKNFEQNSSHGGRIHGNIGVTTSSQMYASWLLTLQNHGNLYDKISTVFLQNFVIPIL